MHSTDMFRMPFDTPFPYVLRNTCAQAQRRETVFCFLSHDLAVGPTHEFEHRSLNPPANAQVMKAITQEHDSSKRMMMTCSVTLTNVTRTDPFKVNRHNVTKEALL